MIKKQFNHSVLLALAAFILCLPMLLFDNLPVRDVAARYAPMAEAFAYGNWQEAFHPRIPPLFTIISGIFARLFHMNGTAACELSSALFFALTVFPLMSLMKKIYNYKYAIWATVMFICSSRLLRIAGMGLRDSAKCFFIVLATYGLVCFFQKYNWKGALYCSLGCIGLSLTRGDSLLFALLFLVAIFFIELLHKKRVPYKSICAGLIFCVMVSPWAYYEYQKTKWPVLEQRHAVILNKTFNNKPLKISGAVAHINSPKTPIVKKKHDVKTMKDFWKNLLKGLCPQYLLFIIPVLIYRIRKKTLSKEELILLSAILIHTAGMIGQIVIADKQLFIYKRYLIVATPLTYGWAAIGLRWIFDKVRRPLSLKYRWFAKAVIIILFTVLVFDGWSRVRKARINSYFYRIVKQYTGANLKR